MTPLRRLALAPLLLLGVALINFFLLRAAPGSAVDAYLGPLGADAGQVAALEAHWSLNQPLPTQLATYLLRLAQGDLGTSFVFDQPVLTLLLERTPTTLLLMSAGAAFAIGAGCALGTIAGSRPGTPTDLALLALATLASAIPGFWFGLMLIVVFSVRLAWLPASGVGEGGWLATARHLILPTLSVALIHFATYLRLMRAGMIELASHDFVRTARAKGAPPGHTARHHIARNALLPVLTLAGAQFAAALGGSVVVETVFAIPGLGRLAYDSVVARDLNTLSGILLASALLVLLVNLATDLAMRALDPRLP